jgi:hypothetical protein
MSDRGGPEAAPSASQLEVAMRRAMGKVMLVAMVACAGLAGTARAQNREKAWELFPYLGYASFGGSTGLNDELSYGFRFGYHLTKQQMIEFGFAGTSTKDSATGNFNADLVVGHANYIYNFFIHRRDRAVLYVSGGLGLINFSTFGITPDPDLVGDENDFMYSYGGGARFFAGEKIGLRVDLRSVNWKNNADQSQSAIEASVGLTIVIGGA